MHADGDEAWEAAAKMAANYSGFDVDAYIASTR